MIPATLQIPAALVLAVGGAVACFAGYRFFRFVLGLFGFLVGALVATSIAGSGSTAYLVLWAVLGGLAGALVLNLAYFFGVVLLGAGLGAAAASVVWSRFEGDPHVLVVIAFAVAGAVAAMLLQRYVIILGTAFGGAWTLLVGVLALAGDEAAQAAATGTGVWVVYPLDPAPGREWVLAVWLALGLAGTLAQVMGGGRTRKKASRRT
jgi:hypothetical protein